MSSWGNSWKSSWQQSWGSIFKERLLRLVKMPSKYLVMPRFRIGK